MCSERNDAIQRRKGDFGELEGVSEDWVAEYACKRCVELVVSISALELGSRWVSFDTMGGERGGRERRKRRVVAGELWMSLLLL